MAGHIFISYCREDQGQVSELRQALISAGKNVWWDQDILPGQDWKKEVRSAMNSAAVVVACFSDNTERRYSSGLFPELRDAIEIYRNLAPGSVFIIPVRFSPCSLPKLAIDGNLELSSLQYIDLFPSLCREYGMTKLLDAIGVARNRHSVFPSVTTNLKALYRYKSRMLFAVIFFLILFYLYFSFHQTKIYSQFYEDLRIHGEKSAIKEEELMLFLLENDGKRVGIELYLEPESIFSLESDSPSLIKRYGFAVKSRDGLMFMDIYFLVEPSDDFFLGELSNTTQRLRGTFMVTGCVQDGTGSFSCDLQSLIP